VHRNQEETSVLISLLRASPITATVRKVATAFKQGLCYALPNKGKKKKKATSREH